MSKEKWWTLEMTSESKSGLHRIAVYRLVGDTKKDRSFRACLEDCIPADNRSFRARLEACFPAGNGIDDYRWKEIECLGEYKGRGRDPNNIWEHCIKPAIDLEDFNPFEKVKIGRY